MTHRQLERLNKLEIRDLSLSILGEVGKRQSVVNYLITQTEGNTFYIIETLRMLAVSTGRLENIGRITLPIGLVSQGMLAIARRRLERLPLDAQPTLRLAAVIGREIDFDLLRYYDDELDYDDWLMACADSALLLVSDGRWRFAHDKLREGILSGIAPDQLPRLHQMAAVALEALYPGNAAYHARLLEHWRMSNDPAKVVHYALLDGKHSVRTGDFIASRERLLPTLDYLRQFTGVDHAQMTILALIAQMEEKTGDDIASRAHYEQSLAFAQYLGHPQGEAAAKLGLARLANRQGDSADAIALAIQALDSYRQQADLSGIIEGLQALNNIYYTQLQLEAAERCLSEALSIAQTLQDDHIMASILVDLGRVAFRQKQFDAGQAYASQALVLQERINDQDGISQSLNLLHLFADRLEDKPRARYYAEASLEIAERIGNRQMVIMLTGNLATWFANEQQYAASRTQFQRAIALERQANLPNLLANHLAALAQVEILMDDWTAARRAVYEWLETAQRINNVRAQIHGFYALIDLALHHQKPRKAAKWLGVLVEHAPMAFRDEAELTRLQAACITALGVDAAQAAIAEGRAAEFDSVVTHILAHWWEDETTETEATGNDDVTLSDEATV
ncbi:MAG: hypothetical protein H7Y11_06445 [Armatimonadetes bacterium]|nr:hypothetical protein [Anaerolineae bacterium]